MTTTFRFYNDNAAYTADGAMRFHNVNCKDDLARFESVYVEQDGGFFYVFADKAHESSDAAPLCFIETPIDPVFGDFEAANKARRIARNALCTYTLPIFEGE